MELTTGIYARLPVLTDKSADPPASAWPLRYWQAINLTSDSHLFRTQAELEEGEGAWAVAGNRFQSPAGEWVPDRKSTRLNSSTNAHLVCRLLLEKKNNNIQ